MFLDDCGGAHDVVWNVAVQSEPLLTITLQPDSGSIIIGDTLHVYVVASPLAAVTGGVAFTVANEPTALHLDSVASFCGASVLRKFAAATFDITTCGATPNDTIAVLYYQTLFGYTDTPAIRLTNLTTSNACDSVQSAGDVTVTLTLPGCDLGQAILMPYTSGINSIFPNPANNAATVMYATGEQATVLLTLCDELGRTLRTIVNATMKPGNYITSFDTHDLVNGIYFITMREGSFHGAREIYELR